MQSWQAIFHKEVLRFWKVSFQTIAAPVLTALLYLLVFSHVMGQRTTVYGQFAYADFLLPGLVMMSVLQNAFANSSSSLIQSKVMGSLIFLLLTPISGLGWWMAYVSACVVRGVCVGIALIVATIAFVQVPLVHPFWVLLFTLVGSAIMGSLGIVAGLWADKFDQIAAFQNFVIMPMTFLSGVFYSVHALPSFWQHLSQLNPFFYFIDGFRYGFLGASDVSPFLSLGIASFALLVTASFAIMLLQRGYKIRTS